MVPVWAAALLVALVALVLLVALAAVVWIARQMTAAVDAQRSERDHLTEAHERQLGKLVNALASRNGADLARLERLPAPRRDRADGEVVERRPVPHGLG